MVSRELSAQIGALSVAFLLLLVTAYFDVGVGTGPAAIAVALLFNGIIFGGAHLYLALRGDDGMVPVEARWRYVAMLGGLLGGGALVYGGDRTIATVTLSTIGIAVMVLAVSSYLVTETIASYRDTRAE
ncbi:hypothetical protein HYG81_16680 [Natrinema zhouii]|uniref:Uncharacterized protein n=1 Tax=Natrinema zhouii TaxID=1710539 RepID=A0A7D6CP62_9EURY|nr:hypothetical protein [Natrinema zhouii]QLK25696.1 hypothetical protein HYG81_16680 [Natrinema zhouii]